MKKKNPISDRKQEHIELCLNEDVDFKQKKNGFEKYDFEHFAATEVEIEKINFEMNFFDKKIGFPFLISSMTGGSIRSYDINLKLAEAANELKIPIGIGSQRQLLENAEHKESFSIIREKAPDVPVLSNIGAYEFIRMDYDQIMYLAEVVNADAIIVHLNPLQEMLQPEGQTNFSGFAKHSERIIKQINIPFIAKEVGSGISKKAAKILLECGYKCIDVAGAGGTSWAGIEILRNKEADFNFWDWGLPTSYCLRNVNQLKKDYNFLLIGSGGINTPYDAAKAFALGADLIGSAKTILKTVEENGTEGVINLVKNWFEIVKKIMYLTGSYSINELSSKIIKKEIMF